MTVPGYENPIDEIPGYSSYLYQQHRYRLPHEFVGYKEPREDIEKYGLGDNCSREELIEKIDSLNTELDRSLDLQDDVARAKDESRELSRQLDLTKKEAANINIALLASDKAKADLIFQSVGLVKDNLSLLNQIIKYGDHHHDCNYIDAINSGRHLKQTELESCTCGWSKRKQDLLGLEEVKKKETA